MDTSNFFSFNKLHKPQKDEHTHTHTHKRRKKEKGNWTKPMCKCTWAFSLVQQIKLSPPSFLHIFGENILVSSGRKYSGFITFFSFPLPTKHPLKNISLHFSPLNFQFYLKSLQTNIPLGILRIALSVLVKPLLDFGHIQVHEDDCADRNSTNYYPPYIYPLRNQHKST